jgi:hypothetical protein
MNASSYLRSSSQLNSQQRKITKGNLTLVYNASGKMIWAYERIFHYDGSAFDEPDANYWSPQAAFDYVQIRRNDPNNVPTIFILEGW